MKIELFFQQQFLGELDLSGGAQSAGQNLSNTIVLAGHPGVAARHARFHENQGTVIVEDLQTDSGTWVNGQRIDRPTVLQNGDRVRLGNTNIQIKFAPCAKPVAPAHDHIPYVHPTPSVAAPCTSTPPAPPLWKRPYLVASIGLIITVMLVIGIRYGITANYYRRGCQATTICDWTQAALWHRKAAERGHPGAQYQLGLCHAKGLGVILDPSAALQWMRRAAARQYPDAWYWLGDYYATGQGVPVDDQQAVQFYCQAAQGGCVAAQYALAQCYAAGRGVDMDGKQAEKWTWHAANAGHTAAQYEFGMQCQSKGSPELAVKYCTLAAQSNYPPAVYHMSRIYAEGDGVASNAAESLNYLRRAANLEYARAEYELGLRYAGGQDVPINPEQAARWFRRAAEQGYAPAQYKFGMCFLTGQGVPENMTEAAQWLARAAENNIPAAQYQYALCLAQGLGVDKNMDASTTWLRRAYAQGQTNALNLLVAYFCQDTTAPNCPNDLQLVLKAADSGNVQAQYHAALYMLQSSGDHKDPKTAVDWLYKAAIQEHADARYLLGLCYLDGVGITPDYAMAVQWISRAATQGHAEAQFRYGEFLERGHGIPQDRQQALRMYLQAAQQGHPRALTNLVNGLIAHTAATGPLSDTAAMDWLKRGADIGMVNAMFELGERHAAGRGGPPDRQQALQWHLAAAKEEHVPALQAVLTAWLDSDPPMEPSTDIIWINNIVASADPETQYRLARCYAGGKGVPADARRAREWHACAAARGHVEAMYELAVIHRDGDDTVTNQTEASRWFQLAAENNHIESQYNLGLLLIKCASTEKKTAAIGWMLKAAHAGHAAAQYTLGICCYKGTGTAQDTPAAVEWLEKSAAQGYANATNALTHISQQASRTEYTPPVLAPGAIVRSAPPALLKSGEKSTAPEN